MTVPPSGGQQAGGIQVNIVIVLDKPLFCMFAGVGVGARERRGNCTFVTRVSMGDLGLQVSVHSLVCPCTYIHPSDHPK